MSLNICKHCKHNIRNRCMLSGNEIVAAKRNCKKFEQQYVQESLFEAVGGTNDFNNKRRSG